MADQTSREQLAAAQAEALAKNEAARSIDGATWTSTPAAAHEPVAKPGPEHCPGNSWEPGHIGREFTDKAKGLLRTFHAGLCHKCGQVLELVHGRLPVHKPPAAPAPPVAPAVKPVEVAAPPPVSPAPAPPTPAPAPAAQIDTPSKTV